jgi:hypothetical protein
MTSPQPGVAKVPAISEARSWSGTREELTDELRAAMKLLATGMGILTGIVERLALQAKRRKGAA